MRPCFSPISLRSDRFYGIRISLSYQHNEFYCRNGFLPSIAEQKLTSLGRNVSQSFLPKSCECYFRISNELEVNHRYSFRRPRWDYQRHLAEKHEQYGWHREKVHLIVLKNSEFRSLRKPRQFPSILLTIFNTCKFSPTSIILFPTQFSSKARWINLRSQLGVNPMFLLTHSSNVIVSFWLFIWHQTGPGSIGTSTICG